MPDKTLDAEEQLAIISRAWGPQRGYCFFPWIRGDAKDKRERKLGYNEGPAFRWPRDRDKILAHMRSHTNDDLYWCPMLFEERKRDGRYQMDEHALWADLDQRDPRTIDDYPPTTAWETSPGRYQALWIIGQGDMLFASQHGGENHRLSYHLGADRSGWDTTQLLRIPGWKNHKPEYREEYGEPPQGKLLWKRGRYWFTDEWDDLPAVPAVKGGITEALEDEVDGVDRREVYARVRLKLSQAVRELIHARETSGDRSEVLWRIERELADAGCSALEIVAILRPTVWNKYDGRADEFKRLFTEATKAVGEVPEDKKEELEEERLEEPLPGRFWAQLENIKVPGWLVEGVWRRESVGFIAGQPKSYKSWFGLDIAFSVATGRHFLGQFAVRQPGPVLLVQEEDSAAMLKRRAETVAEDKGLPGIEKDSDGTIWLLPVETGKAVEDAPIDAVIRRGVVLSEGKWQAWLDEALARGDSISGEKYVMAVLDPLMMLAGEVEENRAQDMTTRIFKPLKQLSEKHHVAIVLVHHMRKLGKDQGGRGGQLMLGSVANHAWAEDALYLRIAGGGELLVERETKHDMSGSFKVSGIRVRGWRPSVFEIRGGDDGDERAAEEDAEKPKRSSGKHVRGDARQRILDLLVEGPMKNSEVADKLGLARPNCIRALRGLEASGLVVQTADKRWGLAE